MSDECCEECRFWALTTKGAGGESVGDCRRYPPVIGPEQPGRQPEVFNYEWCGEFQRLPLPVVAAPAVGDDEAA